ncbi:cupin domain-containing protein [Flavimaricola marinus]|nr:cupin domain-containing protein [Flavimaricola marinus]
MDFDVGARLKSIRKSLGLSQRRLADQSGVTNGLISMIESNKTSPSISSLKKILSVFGLSLADFFETEESNQDNTEKTFVFRASALREINPARVFHEGTEQGLAAVSLKRIGTGRDHKLLMLYETYEPGADTGPETYAHDGEEGGYVIEGEIVLEVDNRTETLQAGDSYLFDSRLPHRFRNVGKTRCVIVSACTPPTF